MKRIFLIPIFTIFILSSCVTSVQPLVGNGMAITDDRITGTWDQNGTTIHIEPYLTSSYRNTLVQSFKKDKGTFDLNEDDVLKNSYVVFYEKGQLTYYFMLSLTRINDQVFGNIQPAGVGTGNEMEDKFGFENEFLAGYTIGRFDMNDRSSVSISFLDGEMIRKQVLAGNMRLKHEYDHLFGTFIVTASTDDLQQFIGKYGKDDRFFSKENSITLKKKG